MAWVLRGLREGIVTTPYPRRSDDYGPSFRAAVAVLPGGGGEEALSGLCPTGAIEDAADGPRLDRGRCILCGYCVAARPDRFAFEPSPEVATVGRQALVVPATAETEAEVERLRSALARRVGAFRRSVHVRHVDAGSDGSEEWEVAALLNPVYDVQRLGVYFTATPRHADVLLVTGAGTSGMAGPLLRTYEAMPEPKVVVAAGTDAAGGGIVRPSPTVGDGIESMLPVDVFVPGSPPSPFSLLHGLLVAVGLLSGVAA